MHSLVNFDVMPNAGGGPVGLAYGTLMKEKRCLAS